MHLRLCFIALFAISVATTVAQQLNEEDRNRYINEIREYKHEFLTKELSLSKEQQRDFFPAYDEMEDRVLRIGTDTRELERQVSENASASDVEIEAAATAVDNQKLKEGEIETEYLEKFKSILSPRQLLSLKNAEKKFTQQLLRHHRRLSRERHEEGRRGPNR